MPSKSAVVAGATGLVGGQLVRLLLDDPRYERVRALVRKPTELRHPKLEQVLVDFDDLAKSRDKLAVDDVFCCLGTTIKKAGSQEAFRRVDHDYPIALAREARAAGATKYVIVTAVGASASSGIFYSRVKGETEDTLRSIPFPRGLVIVRPSMLLGDRGERRAGEAVGKVAMAALGFAFVGGLRKYKAIEAADVARAMIRAANEEPRGVDVVEGDRLFALAKEGS